MTFMGDGTGGFLTLFAAGFLVTEVWRWLGLLVGSNLQFADGPFEWVRAVATALVAALVTRMVLFPAGALAGVPLALRFGAFAGGIALYFLFRRNLLAGVAGGAALLVAAQLAVQG